MVAVAVIFWLSIAAIVYTHVGYPLLLRVIGRRDRYRPVDTELPRVSLIIAAHDEQSVIETKIANSLDLDYPADRFELIIASDGSSDDTVAIAQRAAADDARVKVLDLSRAGKVRTQDAAVAAATGDVVAFSDANAYWEPGALRALVARMYAADDVGYVCGEMTYVDADGSNQEGAYWRFENSTRLHESRLHSVTAGNGAIYAVRREAYLELDPRTSHDLSFPFNLAKRGWLSLYEPAARATERPVPSIEGEFARKRRMMSHAWPMIVRGGMLNPRGYGFAYAFEIFSHRVLRYATPFLHLIALGTNIALLGEGTVYLVTLVVQIALLLAALLGALTHGRPKLLALCQYYLLVTASIAAGLWDWLRTGTPTTWEKAEGRT